MYVACTFLKQREIECEHQVIAVTDATVRNRTKKSTLTGRSAVGFGSSAPRVSRLDSGPAKSQSTGTISSAAAGGSKKSSKTKPAAQVIETEVTCSRLL